MNIPIDSKHAGIRNEKLVLSLLREHHELSQAKLCRMAKLSSSTVSYIIGRLRDKNLILEKPGKSNKRGAKPILVSINPRGAYIIGVEINPSYIVIGLFDFNGELIESVKTINTPYLHPDEVVNLLARTHRAVLEKHDINNSKILGTGVTLSGTILKNGVVRLSSPMGWQNIELKTMLQEHLKCPVDIYSTRVRLLAEIDVNKRNTWRNILYINIANGVGGSIYVDGQLASGFNGRMCEIGHIIVDPDGPECGCGHRGCLEAFVSGPALARRIKNDILQGRKTSLAQRVSPDDIPEEIVRKWGHAIDEDDPYALEIRAFIAKHISRVTTIAINCFDPEIVLLAGYVSQQCPEFLINQIRNRIATDVYDNQSRILKVLPARIGDEALLRGVAQAVLQKSMKI